MKNLMKKHPIATYFTIAFGWSWLVVALLMITGNDNVYSPTPVFILGGLICNVSPTIAAFLVTRASGDKEGKASLKEGFCRKVKPFYLAIALLTVPVVTGLTAILSHQVVREYHFKLVVPMIAMGLIWPLFSGFGEEFGWRGYLLPKMIAKFGMLKAGLLLGVIWELWHVPMHYLGYKDYGAYMIPTFLTVGFINLTLQSMIMTWLFVKSKGSIRLMIMYHYTITASSIILGALFQTDSSPRLAFYESIISIVCFALVTTIYYVKGNHKVIQLKEEKAC